MFFLGSAYPMGKFGLIASSNPILFGALRIGILFLCLVQTQLIFSDVSEKIELLYKNIAALEEEIVVLRNLVENIRFSLNCV